MNQNDNFIGPRRNWLPAGNRELIFGLFALVLGLFGANMVLFGAFRLGFAIAAVLSIALCWGYLIKCGCRGNGYTAALLVLCMIIAAGFGWSADPFVKGWMLLFLLAGVNLAYCQMTGRSRFSPGSARSLSDAAGTFRLGFGKMGMACRGIADAFRSGGALTQRSGAILAGLGIAIPVLAVVIPLLISSDAAFEGLVGLLPELELQELVSTVLVGSFCGLYLYTRAAALTLGEPEDRPRREPKQFQVLTVNTALGAVCAVYLVYLFSQLAYFVGGFSGILPEGFTRAEYARRGFFEMVCLAGVNLFLMTFGVTKVRHTDRAPGSTRALCLFLGLVTEFLAVSSVAKMAMYIGSFGLTRLRVLTTVIMVFLGITTALICLWLYLPKLQYMQLVMLLALTMGAAVLWLDVDTQVAKYNVEHYLSGQLEHVDVSHLYSLGPSSVPYLEQLAEHAEPGVREGVGNCLKNWYLDEADDFRGQTAKVRQAAAILKKWKSDEAAGYSDLP